MPPSFVCARYMNQRQKTLRIIISPGQGAIQIVASKSNVPIERKIGLDVSTDHTSLRDDKNSFVPAGRMVGS